MQDEKWGSQENIDSDELDSAEELDEVLEMRMNKTRARLSQNLEDADKQAKGTFVLSQRLHREPTARTKRAQKMQDAYHRSMGMASHTPEKSGYARVTRENGTSHWTIRRK